MFTNLKVRIQEVENRMTSAINAENAARRAYLDSCNERRGFIQQKLKEIQDQLEAERANNELLPQRLADALIEGNTEAAASLENQINASTTKSLELSRNFEMLSKGTPKGDPETYADVIKTHTDKLEAFAHARSVLETIKVETAALIGDLSAIQTSIELKFKTKLRITAEYPDAQLIQIVESFEGPIDVTGHSAMTDENAKMRYIIGALTGIENTPAGQKLTAKERSK